MVDRVAIRSYCLLTNDGQAPWRRRATHACHKHTEEDNKPHHTHSEGAFNGLKGGGFHVVNFLILIF